MQISDDVVRAAVERYEAAPDAMSSDEAMRAAIEAALAAMENPAWQMIGTKASIDYPGTNLTASRSVVELWKSAGASVRPLYALPSPPSTNKEDGK